MAPYTDEQVFLRKFSLTTFICSFSLTSGLVQKHAVMPALQYKREICSCVRTWSSTAAIAIAIKSRLFWNFELWYRRLFQLVLILLENALNDY
jgi:hypothetical protein